eukprot:5662963-Amphidinium_carterae.1
MQATTFRLNFVLPEGRLSYGCREKMRAEGTSTNFGPKQRCHQKQHFHTQGAWVFLDPLYHTCYLLALVTLSRESLPSVHWNALHAHKGINSFDAQQMQALGREVYGGCLEFVSSECCSRRVHSFKHSKTTKSCTYDPLRGNDSCTGMVVMQDERQQKQ